MSKKLKDAPQTVSVTFDEKVRQPERKAAVQFVERLKVRAELTVTKKGKPDGNER